MKTTRRNLAASVIFVLFTVGEACSAPHEARPADDQEAPRPEARTGGDPDPSLFSIQNPSDRPPQEKVLAPGTSPGVTERNRETMAQALMRDDLEKLAFLVSERGRTEGFSPDMDLGSAKPLMLVQSGQAARILLSHGADPNLADPDRFTPLHFAVTHERGEEIVPVLLRAGADVKARTAESMTPLMLLKFVFIEGKEHERGRRLLEMLTRAGADIDAQDPHGYALLHDAAGNDNVPLARAALSLGARRDLPNADGDTPLAIARKLGSHGVAALLEE
ncbi:MAG: ankyrin repeat domain-containing protein [Thermoanaerobaculia bacterium]